MVALLGREPREEKVRAAVEVAGGVPRVVEGASLSVRMGEALRVCAESGREFALATGPGRMTLPLRLMMGPGARWVVKSGDGTYYDGLSGLRLEWDGERFVPGEEIHPVFDDGVEPEGRQVLVTGTVRHEASEKLMLGGVVEVVYRWLVGSGPHGWGTCEPAAVAWEPASVTEYCRGKAPEPAWFVHVGDGAIGTSEVARAVGGIEETFTVAVAEDVVRAFGKLAEVVCSRYSLVSLTVQAMPGRRDLAAEPYFRGLPAPIGLAVGTEWFDVGGGWGSLWNGWVRRGLPVWGSGRVGQIR
ncbi:hypothetical protein BZB76_1918 [Actinomadura pelletieri DSM 43383]|uniref:Uncharacterized protein n=1 Tax=Actinomadura pelletieri DSM 43383 TaxID=1120940 RepID=A0A495QSS7_9ACTN|nr:hypothetical protein BZB76_1918 [Actinomadura pelletieri DSM 43383]